MRILITSAASTAAYQLKHKLVAQDILLGDYAELPAIMIKNGGMIMLPNPNDASYAHKMLTICLDNGVESLYPLQDTELNLLNEARLLFSEYGIILLSAVDEI